MGHPPGFPSVAAFDWRLALIRCNLLFRYLGPFKIIATV
jgi:hypothetical protein